jgi:DNA-directed RNA polymerase specialized sigma24 family protein
VQGPLSAGLAGLPATWRAVVVARDVLGRGPAETSERLGLSLGQQQAILNRARAVLREGLARRLGPEGSR